jgi:hypothetical protein
MFLNALAVSAIVILLAMFITAFRKNHRHGMRIYNVPVKVALAGLVGTLWLIFGGG